MFKSSKTRKSTALILGVGAAAALLAAVSADARSTTAFSAFHVEGPINSSQNPYECLSENNGAVYNGCGYAVSLEFDLPIDNTGYHSVTIQDYWYGSSSSSSFQCVPYAYTGTGPSSTVGTPVNFYEPHQSLTGGVNVGNNGMSIQVICWDVPAGGGVANINWSA